MSEGSELPPGAVDIGPDPDRSAVGRLTDWFLALPRRWQMAAFGLLLAAAGRLTGLDADVLRALLGPPGPATVVRDRPADDEPASVLQERADQQELGR